MKISEYKKKFEELYNMLEKEHGDVSIIVIKPTMRYQIPPNNPETIVDCSITFSRDID